MGSINKKYEFVIYKFLNRYGYDALEDILKEVDIYDGDLYNIVASCKYSVNFDFKTSLNKIDDISTNIKNRKEVKAIRCNLIDLIDGNPEAIFSEFIENIKIQMINEEYIDFLGRIYRLKEALLKYIFVKSLSGKNKISMLGYMVSKKNILNILKKRYNIYTGNLPFALTLYINKYMYKNKRVLNALKILNSERVENLIRLRNDSPVGHGFRGISKLDIEQIYSNPMNIISDFISVCEYLDLEIRTDKYENINDMIIELISKYSVKGENDYE